MPFSVPTLATPSNWMVIAMEFPVKASEVKRSPWSIRPRTLAKPILLLAIPGGLTLGLLMTAYHPVMVWAHGSEWYVRFDATGKLEAFKYGQACQVANHE